MMRTKKLLGLLLAVIMIFGTMSLSVSAADYSYRIINEYYDYGAFAWMAKGTVCYSLTDGGEELIAMIAPDGTFTPLTGYTSDQIKAGTNGTVMISERSGDVYLYSILDLATGKTVPVRFKPTPGIEEAGLNILIGFEKQNDGSVRFATSTPSVGFGFMIDTYDDIYVTSLALITMDGKELVLPKETEKLFEGKYVWYSYYDGADGIRAEVYDEPWDLMAGILAGASPKAKYYLDEKGNIMFYYENGKRISTPYEKEPPKPVRYTVDLPQEILDILEADGYYDCYEGYLSEDKNTYICYARNESDFAKKYVLEFSKAAAPVFTDVKESDYFASPVAWAIDNKITVGTSANTFSPEKACSRAEILTFLYRAAGSPDVSEYNYTFKNVDKNDYFYNPVVWAMSKDMIPEKENFDPHAPCTRMQAVTYMWAYAGRKASEIKLPFTDLGAYDQKQQQAVAWALDCGVTVGTSETTFDPDKTCTRSQIVTFLWRAFKK